MPWLASTCLSYLRFSDLEHGGAFQQRFHARQGVVEWQLLRHAGIVVRQRQICGFTAVSGEGHPDDACGKRVEAGGFRDEADQRGIRDLVEPALQGFFGQDGFVVAGLDHAAQLQPHLQRGRVRLAGLGRRRGVAGGEFAQPGLEFESFIQLGELALVLLPVRQIIQPHRQLHIALDGNQLASGWKPGQSLAQVFTDHAADLVGMFDQVIQRAILGQPFYGGLGADFFHAGHVVYCIADQCQVIDDQ